VRWNFREYRFSKGGKHGRIRSTQVFKDSSGIDWCILRSWSLSTHNLLAIGLGWHTDGPSLYLQMILGIYATLGVFLIIAALNPIEHLSLIWFMVWSSIVHGGIMAVQALVYPKHSGHLLGDEPVLFIAAAVLAVLTP